MTNYYKILGVNNYASAEEVKTAYRKLSKRLHPDVNSGDVFFEERFKEIQEAYEHLTDDFKKKKHDEELNNQTRKPANDFQERRPSEPGDSNLSDFKNKNKNSNNNVNPKTQKASKKGLLFLVLIFIAIIFLTLYYSRSEDRNKKDNAPIAVDTSSHGNVSPAPAIETAIVDSEKEIGGIKSIKHVESREDFYTIGSSKEEVLRIQGAPTSISKGSSEYWHYGSSIVTFSNDKVSEYSNYDNNLKIKLIDEKNQPQLKEYYTIGSSKQEVLRIQGTPTSISKGSSEYWHYGSSIVTFSNDNVSEYSNYDNNLKIKLIDDGQRAKSKEYYTIGSSKDDVLRIQGNPTSISKGSSEYWHYGSSVVTFDNNNVSEYSNYDNNLKIKLIDEGQRAKSKEYYTIGSSKDDVLRIQGNPTSISKGSSEYWHYGSSVVTFDNDKVAEYSNYDNNLKIRR